jgi:hypothetical protein
MGHEIRRGGGQLSDVNFRRPSPGYAVPGWRNLRLVLDDMGWHASTVAARGPGRRWAVRQVGHDPDRFAEFARRYRTELDDPERAAALGHLRDVATNHPVSPPGSSRVDESRWPWHHIQGRRYVQQAGSWQATARRPLPLDWPRLLRSPPATGWPRGRRGRSNHAWSSSHCPVPVHDDAASVGSWLQRGPGAVGRAAADDSRHQAEVEATHQVAVVLGEPVERAVA